MENLYEIPTTDLSMSLASFVKIIKEKGWPEAKIIRGDRVFLELKRPDGKTLRTHFLTSPKTSYFSGMIASDKLASYFLLEKAGAKQPETWIVPENKEKRTELFLKMIKQYGKIVIKPIGGAHGNGVFVGIDNTKSAEEAYSKDAEGSRVLVQEQLTSSRPEIRVICVDYKFVAGFARIPANVTGDGVHTVSELIKIENETIRTPAYKSDLAYIKEDSAKRYLEQTGKADYVPATGEKVQVMGICNIGNGGTVKDVSAEISEEQKKLSEKIAREFELPVIGIDFFGEDVIEVNSGPSLFYPTGDKSSTICVEKYVEMISKMEI